MDFTHHNGELLNVRCIETIDIVHLRRFEDAFRWDYGFICSFWNECVSGGRSGKCGFGSCSVGFPYEQAVKVNAVNTRVTFSEMCSDDADVKPQEEQEEMKDDSLHQNGMQCDEGHINVHSHPRARPTPACFSFTVSHVEMWLNRELHWNIDWGRGGIYHETREAGRKATWVRHQLLNLVLEFAFIIKSLVSEWVYF